MTGGAWQVPVLLKSLNVMGIHEVLADIFRQRTFIDVNDMASEERIQAIGPGQVRRFGRGWIRHGCR
jgi:hypothetical protein